MKEMISDKDTGISLKILILIILTDCRGKGNQCRAKNYARTT